MSCSGNGYLTGNTLISFPFDDGQSVSWESFNDASDSSDSSESSSEAMYIGKDIETEAQLALNRCFADACFSIDHHYAEEEEWPSVRNLSIGNGSMSFSLCAMGSEKQITVCASRYRFPTVSGKADFGTYVITMSSEGIKNLCSFCAENKIRPSAQESSSSPGPEGSYSMRFCARCVTFARESLSSIKVYDGVGERDSGPHFVVRGDVSFSPGNNMSFSDPGDGVSGFSINAVPGSGLGVVSCACVGSSRKKSISLIKSKDGHVRIFNDTCYDLEPGTIGTRSVGGVDRMSRNLVIHSKCTACCTCEMYERIVNERLASLADMIRSAKSSIDSMLADYESSVSEFNGRISIPTIDDVSMTMTGMPTGGNLCSNLENTGISGKMNRCAFTASIRNMSYAVMSATISSMTGTDSIEEATVSWSEKNGTPMSMTRDSESGIVGSSFSIYPGRSLVITFVSSRSSAVSKAGGNVRYTGSLSASMSYTTDSGATGNLGVVSKSVEV